MTILKLISGLGMRFLLPAFLAAVIAYLCGCFNGAIIVSRYILKNDVRKHGSGNAGLTNFHRTFGGGWMAVVILLDMLKAAAALIIGSMVFRELIYDRAALMLFAKYWAALFCLLGHMYPCMFRFRGGKGILSGGMIAILIDWRIALVVWGGFLILVLLTRYVSLGSVWAGASFPFASWFCYPDLAIVALAFLCGGLVVWKHRGNIRRLIRGRERKISFRRKES